MRQSSGDVVALREALQELVATDGWRVFLAHINTEWTNEGYMQRMRMALLAEDNLQARVVDLTAQEIQRIAQWPKDTLVELKGIDANE